MKAEELTWEAVIKLFQDKPELVEKYTGLKINRETLVNDYQIKAAKNVRTDMVFADTDGKEYIVKINYQQDPLFGLRDVNLWNKRYAEDKAINMFDITPILICDKNCIEEYHNKKELDRFGVKYVTYEISDILKEFDS